MKVCKVYLTTEVQENQSKIGKYAFGIVTRIETEVETRANNEFIREFLYLRSIKEVPNKIDYYRDLKQVEFIGEVFEFEEYR